MLAITGCLASFALMLLMYGIFRNPIMTHLPASILIGTVWNFREWRQLLCCIFVIARAFLMFAMRLFFKIVGPSAITFVEIAIATK